MTNELSRSIYALYHEYIRWSSELMKSYGGVKMFTQMFTGGGEYKNREEHGAFFKNCEKAAGEYLAAVEAGTEEREELLRLLQYVLVDCHGQVDDWAEWMLLAVEKHFIPFVDLLSREEAQSLVEPYRRLRRQNKGLPPQDEILKKLKKICK